jgi:hypothetical protein
MPTFSPTIAFCAMVNLFCFVSDVGIRWYFGSVFTKKPRSAKPAEPEIVFAVRYLTSQAHTDIT